MGDTRGFSIFQEKYTCRYYLNRARCSITAVREDYLNEELIIETTSMCETYKQRGDEIEEKIKSAGTTSWISRKGASTSRYDSVVREYPEGRYLRGRGIVSSEHPAVEFEGYESRLFPVRITTE